MRAIALLALVTPLALGQPLTQGERDRALSELHAGRKMFLDALAGLTPAQLDYKPAPDRWSIREIAEHVIQTEESLFKLITERILKSPPQPEKATPQQRSKDELVLKNQLDRTQKRQAPPELQPTGRRRSLEELVTEFKAKRDRTISWVRETQAPLRLHFAPSGDLGDLDAYQWIMLLAGHTERHVEQIREVKESPGFPKP